MAGLFKVNVRTPAGDPREDHTGCVVLRLTAYSPVGFAMIRHDYPEPGDYYLLRLVIDAAHQGRGYGRRALERLVEHVRTLRGASALRTSYDLGEGHAGPFYAKLGFVETGAMNGDEVELILPL